MDLRELGQPVDSLEGVGPRTAERLRSLGLDTVGSLLCHFPRDYIDRSKVVPLASAADHERAVCVVRVLSQTGLRGRGAGGFRAAVEDDSGRGDLLVFGRPYLRRVLAPGACILVSGSFLRRQGRVRTSSFDLEVYDPEAVGSEPVVPVYPLTAGLTQRSVRRIMRAALRLALDTAPRESEESVPEAVDLPADLRARAGLTSLAQALSDIHFPAHLSTVGPARRYFKYRELFILVLKARRRARKTARKRRPVRHRLRDELLGRLPFALTRDQRGALAEIESDLFSPYRMARLLQGDVGCGKTLVALLAACSVIEAGEQAALMVPTELLALQHAEVAARLLEPLGVNVALLSSAVGPEARELLLSGLERSEIQLLVGTHSLFSDDVRYGKLGLAIVDEQHRFGVRQRSALLDKAEAPDLLLMSATPIPRSLALTAFGDLSVSAIRTLPPGRTRVATHLAALGNETKVYDWVQREIEAGHQAYVVYPRIDENREATGATPDSGQPAIKGAEQMYDRLRTNVFPGARITLIHSRMDEELRRSRMQAFRRGEVDILVATSVVEVGVHVPRATCMVVEHAERFGLSTLHQLRGRVGRGSLPSAVFLVYDPNLTPAGVRRLRVMKETVDGFRIAEEDLRLRGPGELLGVRQSGAPILRIARLDQDEEILMEAAVEVRRILGEDPGLEKPENAALRRFASGGLA